MSSIMPSSTSSTTDPANHNDNGYNDEAYDFQQEALLPPEITTNNSYDDDDGSNDAALQQEEEKQIVLNRLQDAQNAIREIRKLSMQIGYFAVCTKARKHGVLLVRAVLPPKKKVRWAHKNANMHDYTQHAAASSSADGKQQEQNEPRIEMITHEENSSPSESKKKVGRVLETFNAMQMAQKLFEDEVISMFEEEVAMYDASDCSRPKSAE